MKYPTDEEFIAKLKTIYAGVDVDRELRKMDAWLLTPAGAGRQKTRGFIVNWLGKSDARFVTPTKPICKACQTAKAPAPVRAFTLDGTTVTGAMVGRRVYGRLSGNVGHITRVDGTARSVWVNFEKRGEKECDPEALTFKLVKKVSL